MQKPARMNAVAGTWASARDVAVLKYGYTGTVGRMRPTLASIFALKTNDKKLDYDTKRGENNPVGDSLGSVEMLGHVVTFVSQEYQSRRSSVTCFRRNTPGDTAEGDVEESTSTR